jgi:CheY-like chemotaxis protein
LSKPLAIIYYATLMPGSQVANKLQDLGYRVQALTDPAGLVALCQKEKPLLVVAELMPAGAALAAIGRLKKDAATGHLPVLAYSAVQDAALQAQAREAGVSLLAGHAAISEHLTRLLDQVLQVE